MQIAGSEEAYVGKAVGQYDQGIWLSVKDYINHYMSWRILLSFKHEFLPFRIGATFNTMATTKNITWMKFRDEDSCSLCS